MAEISSFAAHRHYKDETKVGVVSAAGEKFERSYYVGFPVTDVQTPGFVRTWHKIEYFTFRSVSGEEV